MNFHYSKQGGGGGESIIDYTGKQYSLYTLYGANKPFSSISYGRKRTTFNWQSFPISELPASVSTAYHPNDTRTGDPTPTHFYKIIFKNEVLFIPRFSSDSSDLLSYGTAQQVKNATIGYTGERYVFTDNIPHYFEDNETKDSYIDELYNTAPIQAPLQIQKNYIAVFGFGNFTTSINSNNENFNNFSIALSEVSSSRLNNTWINDDILNYGYENFNIEQDAQQFFKIPTGNGKAIFTNSNHVYLGGQGSGTGNGIFKGDRQLINNPCGYLYNYLKSNYNEFYRGIKFCDNANNMFFLSPSYAKGFADISSVYGVSYVNYPAAFRTPTARPNTYIIGRQVLEGKLQYFTNLTNIDNPFRGDLELVKTGVYNVPTCYAATQIILL